MSIPRRRSEAGGDERQMTRRAVIATGAAAYGAGMLWATTASAQRPREDPDSNGAGGVYVFNCYNEPVTGLGVLGYAAGDIPPYSDGRGGLQVYTPGGIEVPRSQDQGSVAQFRIGANTVQIPWDSFVGTTTITIPDSNSTPPVSLEDDLILFLAVNSAMLLTTRGYLLNSFLVTQRQA